MTGLLEHRRQRESRGLADSHQGLTTGRQRTFLLRPPRPPQNSPGLSLGPGLGGTCAASFRFDGSLVCSRARRCFIRYVDMNFLVFPGTMPFHSGDFATHSNGPIRRARGAGHCAERLESGCVTSDPLHVATGAHDRHFQFPASHGGEMSSVTHSNGPPAAGARHLLTKAMRE